MIPKFDNFINENNSYEELLTEIDRLTDIVNSIFDKFDKEWFSKIDSQKIFKEDTYNEYVKQRRESAEPHYTKLVKLNREKKRVMPYNLSEIPDYGDVMNLDDFIRNVKSGGFIDYDGSGRYIKDKKMTNIEIVPSDIKNNCVRKEFKKIVWFNR